MVTDVMNAAQYARIVPCDSFTESICDYIGIDFEPDNDTHEFSAYETINFNSKLIK